MTDLNERITLLRSSLSALFDRCEKLRDLKLERVPGDPVAVLTRDASVFDEITLLRDSADVVFEDRRKY